MGGGAGCRGGVSMKCDGIVWVYGQDASIGQGSQGTITFSLATILDPAREYRLAYVSADKLSGNTDARMLIDEITVPGRDLQVNLLCCDGHVFPVHRSLGAWPSRKLTALVTNWSGATNTIALSLGFEAV